MKQPRGLVSVLLDPDARTDERDDAAMDLSSYSEPEVEDALVKAGCDPTTPEIVLASCGESLAEIWIRRGQFNRRVLDSLSPVARSEALAYLEAKARTIRLPKDR